MDTVPNVVVIPERVSRVPAELFADFEITERKRPGAFIASFSIQATVVALVLIVILTSLAPILIQKKYNAISLVAPTLSAPSPARQPAVRVLEPQPPVVSPVLSAPVVRTPAPQVAHVDPSVDVPTPPAPKPVLQPNLLLTVPPMPVAKPVHTGSFEETRSVPVQQQTSAPNRAPALAVAGSFGTPATGTGPLSRRGVATGAVFGTQSGVSNQVNKAVTSVDFSEPGSAKASPVVAKVSPITSVAIQSKPAPVYTEEARRLRVEGDVVVQVVFTAAGEIRIVGVVKGLGHGLDEAAVAATRQIRFIPARRDGQLIDYPATIHVVFALS